MKKDIVSKRYLDDSYLESNPDWDSGDAPWKSKLVHKLLVDNGVFPRSICDVGCGSGGCLYELSKLYPDTSMTGYDIAPSAASFWNYGSNSNIRFINADASTIDGLHCDVLLMLDVIEHVGDPYEFLASYIGKAKYYVLHIPLDLSSVSVFRETPLLHVREKVGHIHYYTKSLALSLLRECGYDIVSYSYTNAAFTSPQRTLKTTVAGVFRFMVNNVLGKDAGVRLLGGETLIVLARMVEK